MKKRVKKRFEVRVIEKARKKLLKKTVILEKKQDILALDTQYPEVNSPAAELRFSKMQLERHLDAIVVEAFKNNICVVVGWKNPRVLYFSYFNYNAKGTNWDC